MRNTLSVADKVFLVEFMAEIPAFLKSIAHKISLWYDIAIVMSFTAERVILMLIRCKECGKKISDEASACPYCGCPKEKQTREDIPSYQERKKMQFKNKVGYSKYTLGGIALIIVAFFLFLYPIQSHETILESVRLDWYMDALDDGTLDETMDKIYNQLKDDPEYVSAGRTMMFAGTLTPEYFEAAAIRDNLVERAIAKMLAPQVLIAQMPFFLAGIVFLLGGLLLVGISLKRKPVEGISPDSQKIEQ